MNVFWVINLATTTALTAVENKIANASNSAKKANYNTKFSEIENKITTYRDKYIATQEFNNLTSEKFTVRLAQAHLASKSYIANFAKETDFDDKLKTLNKDVTSNKTHHILVENKLNELSKKTTISTKGLAKNLINKFSILNGPKYFLQEYFRII